MDIKYSVLIILALNIAGTAVSGERFLKILDIPTCHPPSHALTGVGEFRGKGILEKIYSNRIIVDDLNFYFAPDVNMVKSNGRRYTEPLKEKSFVYYFLNKDKQISKIVIKEETL